MASPVLPLILIHGSGHTHQSFDAQCSAFAACDAVSLPGHPEGRALASVGDCATWLAKYVRWKGAGQAIVGGNSLGGAVAIEFALRYPELTAGLVLLGTGARLRVGSQIFAMIDERWPACIADLVDLSLARDAPDTLRNRVAAWHAVVGKETTRRDYANCNEFDVMDRVASIRTRALIVVGAEDRMTPPKYADFLHTAIAGSESAVVEGAGHMAHAERPEVVNDLIRKTFPEVVT